MLTYIYTYPLWFDYTRVCIATWFVTDGVRGFDIRNIFIPRAVNPKCRLSRADNLGLTQVKG